MKERDSIWRVAANILNKQSRRADKGLSSSLDAGLGLVFWFDLNKGELKIFISKIAG